MPRAKRDTPPVLDVAALLGGARPGEAAPAVSPDPEIFPGLTVEPYSPRVGGPTLEPAPGDMHDPTEDPDLGKGDPLVDASADTTIGDLVKDEFHATADEPYMGGFVMSDEPIPVPSGVEHTPEGISPQATPAPPVQPVTPGAITPPDDDIVSPREQRLREAQASGAVRYEGRIRVMEAFQYLGSLVSAPTWIDRSWAAYADHDDLRGIPPGPALRVPLPSGQTVLCRVGDYVVQQEVTSQIGVPGEVRTEVWAKGDFEKNFLPAI